MSCNCEMCERDRKTLEYKMYRDNCSCSQCQEVRAARKRLEAIGKKPKPSVKDIPGAMRKMGWTKSAALMDYWFSNPYYVMPEEERGGMRNGAEIDMSTLPRSRYSENVIKMDWLLTHGTQWNGANTAFSELVEGWRTDALRTPQVSGGSKAYEQLRKRLQQAYQSLHSERVWWEPGQFVSLGPSIYLGELPSARSIHHVCQINARTFGRETNTFNDLFGAVFRGTLNLVVIGRTTVMAGIDYFRIEKMGVFMFDTYDFHPGSWWQEQTWGLGVWSKERCLDKENTIAFLALSPHAQATIYPGFRLITNQDFRDWQREHNEGGDFYVYSDIKWVTFSPHLTALSKKYFFSTVPPSTSIPQFSI